PIDAARERLGLDARGRMVLVVGHLIERKDPLLSLAAFAAASPGPEDALVFVGRGPLEGAVRTRADELGLGARVTLAGERPPEELVDWYRAASALLLTSSREGRPNVVLEALSCGRPVLATDAGGTSELLRDARMLAKTRDPEALGGMLRGLLDDSPPAEDLRRSVAHLTWDASLDALTAVLEAVAATPR
ncbi:MAG: glycosyltransferase, partial [Planctomycetota bacterium]